MALYGETREWLGQKYSWRRQVIGSELLRVYSPSHFQPIFSASHLTIGKKAALQLHHTPSTPVITSATLPPLPRGLCSPTCKTSGVSSLRHQMFHHGDTKVHTSAYSSSKRIKPYLDTCHRMWWIEALEHAMIPTKRWHRKHQRVQERGH